MWDVIKQGYPKSSRKTILLKPKDSGVSSLSETSIYQSISIYNIHISTATASIPLLVQSLEL
jgi:hypothetical protein